MPLFQNESKCGNLSYENEFCIQFHFHANQSHSHKNGFAIRLALRQRHKGSRKRPIEFVHTLEDHSSDFFFLENVLHWQKFRVTLALARFHV